MGVRDGEHHGGVSGVRRCVPYICFVALLSVVCDGWSGKPSLLVHQLLLLPLLISYSVLLWALLGHSPSARQHANHVAGRLPRWLILCLAAFELWSLLFFAAEARHFQGFGYHLYPLTCSICAGGLLFAWVLFFSHPSAKRLFVAIMGTFAVGMIVAIRCFPLNYFRSDMLPVIGWADGRLLQHMNPYGTMHVGTRLYDFPYLPGMLVAFWPAAFLHLDLRWATLSYLGAAAVLIFWAACERKRLYVAALLGVFLLCPFLQYRHDLYLEPHWFAIVLAVVLMERRRFLWSAAVWGVSCAIYQLSWVIFPFVLLNAYRRRGILEMLKVLGAAVVGVLLVSGPFLRSASSRIADNTVGQWSRLPHALADPINLSYWLTYVVRPDHLKWVQAAVLVTLFGFCFVRQCCRTLDDTLRWMCWALGIFIPLNVIVDGYFYLTLALMLLLYLCAATGWWDRNLGVAEDSDLLAVAQPSQVLSRG